MTTWYARGTQKFPRRQRRTQRAQRFGRCKVFDRAIGAILLQLQVRLNLRAEVARLSTPPEHVLAARQTLNGLMVLVDTSVWIRFLAGRSPYAPELERLLALDEVTGHEFVYGEPDR